MKLLSSRFREAMLLSSASAAASVRADGSRIASWRAIVAGTISSSRLSSDAAPTAASISA
jgi:hypothetical protein